MQLALAPPSKGSSSSGGGGSGGAPRPTHPPSADLEQLQQLLVQAFRQFPRVVLSTCLQALRKGDKSLTSAALAFFGQQLLKPLPLPPPPSAPTAASTLASPPYAPQPSSSAAGAALTSPPSAPQPSSSAAGAASTGPAAVHAGMSHSSSSGQGAPPSTPLASNSGGGSSWASAGPTTLAAEVLLQLPDTQQWLRQAIFALSKGEVPDSRAHCCWCCRDCVFGGGEGGGLAGRGMLVGRRVPVNG